MLEPNTKRRKNLRIPEYDYSLPGAYFITIVTQNRINFFGKVMNEMVQLSQPGEMIVVWWTKLGEKFSGVTPAEYVVMPNHFHGIIEFGSPNNGITLGTIIQWFKTMTTNEYIRGVNQLGWRKYYGRLWQHNYYEHIIRSDEDYENICSYIQNNPAEWDLDLEYSKENLD